MALSTPGFAQTIPTPDVVIEVVATTPVPGIDTPKDQIPSNVQTADDRKLRQLQSVNLPDFLQTLLPSVSVNEIQGNPFQLDVNYRGFTASPLLGTPQGLSVFQDGVRVNEPFGDIVNWDLIPTVALSSITLLPGSNPLFGLNTLGGALSLQTKRGDTHPGAEFEILGGSFGRVSGELAYGRKLGDQGHLYAALAGFDEDGWRDFSPSRVKQLFVKAGGGSADASWELSYSGADSRLVGNGLLPEAMLEEQRTSIYTRPDETRNKLSMLTLNATARFGERNSLATTAYVRNVRTSTLNGDVNDEYDPPDETESGVENRTSTKQRGEGVTLQWTYAGASHQFTGGISYDNSRSDFSQSEAEGELDDTRAVMDAEEAETTVQLRGKSRTTSVYVSDLWALRPNLHLTLSARYNETRVTTVDEGRESLGLDTQLDAKASYRKLNPAAGLTWQATPQVTLYGSWSQGNRAPSPIELGCSDPANPCVLPNAMQADPPLNQVVSRTVEAGARGIFGPGFRWNASLYQTVNRDDILFVSSGLATGYFTNFGRTRRKGVELGLSQRVAGFDWSASYSYLRATFDSSACLVSEANSTAESSPNCPGDDEIEVQPGDRLPGLPEHTFKLVAQWQPSEAFSVGAQLRAYSGQFVRGNENNAHRPDGVEFFGSGRVSGFYVLDLTTQWKVARNFELFAKVTNVFDRQYATAGLLAVSAFDAQGALQNPADWSNAQFLAPGAPRAAWLGVRVQWDKLSASGRGAH